MVTVESNKGLNVFVDWSRKKGFATIIEKKSAINVQPDAVLTFESFRDLISSIKQSSLVVNSEISESLLRINCFMERGIPYFFLHLMLSEGFKVYLVKGSYVKKLRGNRPKTDEADVGYIRELYYKSPELFKLIDKKEAQEIKIQALMAKYIHFTKALAREKQHEKSAKLEYGEDGLYRSTIEELSKLKKGTLSELCSLFEGDIKRIIKTVGKGVGKVTSLELLADAHPNKYHSLSSWHFACGYMASSYYKDPKKGYVKGNMGGEYKHLAHVTLATMARNCERKTSKWRPIYLKLKEDTRKKFPPESYPKKGYKAMIEAKTRNRLATKIQAAIWKEFHGDGEESSTIINSVKESSVSVNSSPSHKEVVE